MAAQLALTLPGRLVAAGGKQPCAILLSIFNSCRRAGREQWRLPGSRLGEKALAARLAPALAL